MAPIESANENWEAIRRSLTEFQYSVLYVLAEGSDYGLGIKKELQDYYDEEINHGRLYPNLNKMTDGGLLQKSAIDSRTNEYVLTEHGLALALDRLEWGIGKLVPEDERAGRLVSELDEAVLGTVPE